MTTRLRLLVLVSVLMWTVAFGSVRTEALAGPRHAGPRWLPSNPFHLHSHHRHAAVRTGIGTRAARYARRLIGIPYRYGGESPRGGFDCSGLVRYVFGRFGLDLPHSSYADFGVGRNVARRSLRPGDLVFFDGLGHVGLYVGAGRFIHAPHAGTTVQIASLSDPWYRSRYEGARRVVRSTAREIRSRVIASRLG